MHLKKLDMQGFKSFPDKISLDFTTGMTAIVGPNGSGKSNITDAVRWVLGEQSARMLRGSKMEDVIFNGTDSRKPLGFAEVSVTFDNSDKKLNIDYDEVTVTRRVFRSGEGEYFINKSACRLKDVHELFMDTGLGRDGYSIIGQGKIDEILSNKSEDRRQIFEEAAGISKFKYRRLEANRKLSGTQDNLNRITDILTELEDRIGPLEVQSEKAKKYLELRERLKALEATVSVLNIDRIKSAISDIDAEYRGMEESCRQCNEGLSDLDRQINDLYASIGTTEQEIAGIRETVSSFEGDIRLNLNEIELHGNTITQNNNESERLKVEIATAGERILAAKKEIQDKSNLIADAREAVLNKKLEIEQKSLELAKKVQEEEDAAGLLKTSDESASALAVTISEIRAELSGADALCESYNAQRVESETKRNALVEKITQYKDEVLKLDSSAAFVKKQIAELDKKYIDESARLEGLKRKLDSDDRLLLDRISLCSSKKDRIQLFMELERDYEGYHNGVRSVMQAKDGELKRAKIIAPLSRLIDVDPQYILAIETALGNALQNIVTETEEDAKVAIEYLKRTKQGRVTFLPVSSVKPRSFEYDPSSCKGFIGVADKLVYCDDRYRNVLSSLLGAVAIADNIDNAVAMSKKFSYKFKIVTLEGEIINAGGSITGGTTGKSSGILTRAGDRKKLEEEVAVMEKSIAAAKARNEKAHLEFSQSQSIIEEIKQRQSMLDQEYMEIAAKHNNASYSISEGEKEISELTKAISAIDERMHEIAEQTRDKRVNLETYKKDLEKLGNESSFLRDRFEKAAAEAVAFRKQISFLDKELAELEKTAAVEAERINSVNAVIDSEERGVTASKSRIEALAVMNSGLQAEIQLKHVKIKELHEKIDGQKARLVQIEEGKDERADEIAAVSEKIKEERDRYASLQQQLARIETKKNKNEMEHDAIINRLWDDYGLTYMTAFEYKVEIDSLPKAQREISSVKSQISSLGNINIDAIEEYRQVKERYDFMKVQHKDLTEAKESLEKIIADMQELMKTIFSEQFKIINENFGETFRHLFGGGRAELKLSDPSDILESGIDIDVQPPGKKLQNLMLLSGGEKALCAIAIMFAILKTRPAPFCIFDEIEAALDDINVYKFADYMKSMNKKTQFMVVTHRRGTMESADKLYGVTMPKKGISTMIELDVSELDKKIKGE